MVNINNVKFQWLEVATSALLELKDIHDERGKTLSYMKKWTEETLLIGTDVNTQQFIYIAMKSKGKDGFYSHIGYAIESQEKYILTLD